MTQSRRHSALEACANVVAGYAVAMATQYAVFPLFGIHISHGAHFGMSTIFVATSLARSYALRRLFNRWHHAG